MPGYGTDEGFTAYALANGYTVPEGTLAAARQRGSAYIDATYEERFGGEPTGGVEQDRAWPRTGATAYGTTIDPDVIPRRVLEASYEAALLELTQPGSLSVVVTGNKRIVEVKAGSAGVRYSESGDLVEGAVPMVTRIEGLLAPLLGSSVTAPAIWVV